MIPYGKHYLDEDDVQAVVDVLRTGALTQGPKIAEFEKRIAEYTGAKYAIAVSSGTAALHLACIAADLGEGDKVFTSANTFVASANCALYVGATPEFTDIDPNTLNMDPDDLYRRCKSISNVKGIIPVHFAGLACNMARIREIANEFDSILIEDASHALGATYADGSKVGNCRYSEMTVFSFHPVKGIAAGEGGMITTNDEHIFQRLLKLRSHGICKGNFEFPGISIPDNDLMKPDRALEGTDLKMWYYEMQELGYNYRITDIQCALAISQMKKINIFLERRQEIAATYDMAFQSFNWVSGTQLEGRRQSSHHIYVVRINFSQLEKTRHQFMKKLSESEVGTQVHYIPVPMHPYYETRGYQMSDYPETEEYYRHALSIPMYYELSDTEQQHVINSIVDIAN
ncbi:MAG TPA: UDP-4-amino-4,6-dideoxy-N-acetyl-beta-L-altrosamine transaminase [candidate division Zixibacteria bacterium]|nr:UDP-4-amino-4,6-dideoxy-N-acetyl-beta-L-altrosamine transaminase [candidate division Zixibacteria bacterium]